MRRGHIDFGASRKNGARIASSALAVDLDGVDRVNPYTL
jgi:hypothetical protein